MLQWFIQQITLRRLGKKQSDAGSLTFTPGKRAKWTVGEAGQFHSFNSLDRDIPVNVFPTKYVSGMGMPPQQHIFIHIAPELAGFFLQHDAELASKLAPRPG